MSLISPLSVKELTKGRIFAVTFTKKDGSLRKMLCRCGVKKHLSGGVAKWKPEDNNMLCVFDMSIGEYRTINFSTLQSIKFKGITYLLK